MFQEQTKILGDSGETSSSFLGSIALGKKVGQAVFTEKISEVNIWSKALSAKYLEGYTKCISVNPIEPDIFSWKSDRVSISNDAIREIDAIENPCDKSANIDDVLLPTGEDDFYSAKKVCSELGGEIYFPTNNEEELDSFVEYARDEAQRSTCKDWVWTNIFR